MVEKFLIQPSRKKSTLLVESKKITMVARIVDKSIKISNIYDILTS